MINTYLVAAQKPWNIDAFRRHSRKLQGNWHLVTDPQHLTRSFVKELNPRYIFFPHWSYLVPSDVLEAAECVCFHATDVPFGRGGSPIQNLISRGYEETKVSALRMVKQLDAGPVYFKEQLGLHGSAQQVFERMAELIWTMIEKIVIEEMEPKAQAGPVVCFQRRVPSQSELPQTGELIEMYNHIRMLDAETYPKAFVKYGDFRIEITNAEIKDDAVLAKISIRKQKCE